MMASEFDTVEELVTDLRRRRRSLAYGAGPAARDKAHEALLELVDFDLPDGVIEAELAEHFGDGHGDAEHRAETEARLQEPQGPVPAWTDCRR